MKVTVRGDRLTIDLPSIALVIAALETASNAWLDHAADHVDNLTERKSLLKMAGQATALAILIEAKQAEPDAPPLVPTSQQEMPV